MMIYHKIFKLYCQRIDDKRSKNQRGAGGNQWLHPDIVAMQAIDKEWHELVRTCVQEGEGRRWGGTFLRKSLEESR